MGNIHALCLLVNLNHWIDLISEYVWRPMLITAYSVCMLISNHQTGDCHRIAKISERERLRAFRRNPDIPFHLVAATDKFLRLFDLRYMRKPLFSWKHPGLSNSPVGIHVSGWRPDGGPEKCKNEMH